MLRLLLFLSTALHLTAAVPAAPAAPAAASPPPPPAPFTFAAFGCLPYARVPDADAQFARLLAEVDRHAPAFSVHCGDTMASDEKCTDELLRRRLDDFNSVAGALVYTPGDNEWTDTHSERAGRYDPLERLARIRELYFPAERSLGRRPIPLVTQRRDPAHAAFVENARWSVGGVVFATVHVVGSLNNRNPALPGALDEWRARDAANVAWIEATFAAATAQRAPGIALFFQANPFVLDRITGDYHAGFAGFLRAVETGARAFGRPVLLVHADEHRYRHEVGIRFRPDGERVPNVTRLETFGAASIHGVLVAVDPASAEVFVAGPLLVPGNPLPLLPRAKAAKK